MINIKVEYDPEKDCTVSDGHIEIHGQETAINEVAAVFTTLFRSIPKHEFLEGLIRSEFGQEVYSKS